MIMYSELWWQVYGVTFIFVVAFSENKIKKDE